MSSQLQDVKQWKKPSSFYLNMDLFKEQINSDANQQFGSAMCFPFTQITADEFKTVIIIALINVKYVWKRLQ